jgi:hypothetical protein
VRVKLIVGDSNDKLRIACYDYLLEKFRRENRDRNICQSQHRRASETRVQSERSTPTVPSEGGYE